MYQSYQTYDLTHSTTTQLTPDIRDHNNVWPISSYKYRVSLGYYVFRSLHPLQVYIICFPITHRMGRICLLSALPQEGCSLLLGSSAHFLTEYGLPVHYIDYFFNRGPILTDWNT